jgi:hypothetical protein
MDVGCATELNSCVRDCSVCTLQGHSWPAVSNDRIRAHRHSSVPVHEVRWKCYQDISCTRKGE